ncbi:pentatricopeptide repeat-containing protein At3g62890-like [Andrographis paniculata]|uniref:pentatricopeptide repeat-containing protein At3g62890-like n=1 Tax=Andrographis paniculata TaxID=175694 RepID=UPI0021E8EA5B|nr:pentatricopeptide repeat-containing protein At3g62890-like [Andrographis paniculata]
MYCLFPSASLCGIASMSFEQGHGLQTSSKLVLGAQEADSFRNFKSPSELQQAHALLIKTRTSLRVLPLLRVASVCALTPSFSYAQQIFHHVEQREISMWNHCLRNFVESDSPWDAILLFHQMRRHNVFPDCFTCSFVLNACVKLLDVFHGRIVHAFVVKLGLQFNLVLQNAIVHLYACCGQMNDAALLFDKMPQRDVVTWNTMITQLMKKGDTESAYKMFVEMPERNLRSWTAMISGFAQCGKPKQAVDLFMKMEEVGLKPNEVTLVAVLAACADLGALDLGIRIHSYSDNRGFEGNIQICNTLIDMYIKCGSLKAAYDIFRGMKKRTVISWSAMIQGLAIHGKGNEALELFPEMIRSGMTPNEVTFVGILTACSHMGLISEGRAFFASMTRDYGIIPCIEHYGCMVDLLSRSGLLQEAYEFIKQMPIKPNAAVWGAILGGCKVHKNVEMAEVAMSHLQELDPKNDGYYIVLANIYSEAKRWDDAAKMRKFMRNSGLMKTLGCSSITVKGTVHEFVAGDESHPQSVEIYKMWNQLQVHMRLKGYQPNTSVVLLDMEEKEKEKLLSRHSEKLALAFSLINTQHGETIRIFKNLRICEDCHAAFKLISEIMRRKIVVRDRNRFHCFEDGSCSCMDYW